MWSLISFISFKIWLVVEAGPCSVAVDDLVFAVKPQVALNWWHYSCLSLPSTSNVGVCCYAWLLNGRVSSFHCALANVSLYLSYLNKYYLKIPYNMFWLYSPLLFSNFSQIHTPFPTHPNNFVSFSSLCPFKKTTKQNIDLCWGNVLRYVVFHCLSRDYIVLQRTVPAH